MYSYRKEEENLTIKDLKKQLDKIERMIEKPYRKPYKTNYQKKELPERRAGLNPINKIKVE